MSGEKNLSAEQAGIPEVHQANERFPEDRHAPKQPALAEASTDKPETKNMEVHHHGHVHHQKKWKEYLFQFLMLFLAVTLGFFVENQREHYIERQRAKQYAGLLIADLEHDRSFFNKEISRLSKLQGRFDSLINLLRQQVPASNDTLSNLLLNINYVSDAKLIAATYNQMKMSGSLRYINNLEVINSLQEYYEIQLPRCIKSSESSLQFFQDYILPFFIDNVRQKNEPVIIGRSADSDQRLSNVIEKANTILMIAYRFYEPAERKAGELIDRLKTEYHPE